MIYFIAPFIGWFIAGTMKYAINYIRFGSEAKRKIGNGGFPSNHTTILVTEIMYIGLQDGFATPIFGLGVAITFIVIIDAIGLRRQVGYHAENINQLNASNPKRILLRESMGHKKYEVLGGIVLGGIIAFILNYLTIFIET